MTGVREERERVRDMETAIRRTVWEHCLWSLRVYVLGEAKASLWDLVRAAEAAAVDIEARPARRGGGVRDAAVSRLRSATFAVKEQLNGLGDPDAAGGGVFVELRRLRAAVQAQAAALHTQYGQSSGADGPCRCPGCELVRSIDDIAQEST